MTMSFIVKGCKINGQASATDIVVSGGAVGGASDSVFQFDISESRVFLIKKP